MNTNTAVPPTTLQVDHQHYDYDEPLGFDEAKADRDVVNRLDALDAVKSRKRVYRTTALDCPALPPMQCRVLCRALEFADPDLSNAFPKVATIAKAMGVSVRVIKWNLACLRKNGWIRRHKFRSELTGRRGSSGIQFFVPPRVLTPLSTGWEGPKDFTKRDGVIVMEKGKKKCAI